MGSLAILIPVLGRPWRVAPTVEGFQATVPDAELVFICTPSDHEEIGAVEVTGSRIVLNGGNYATKINDAVAQTTSSLLFLAADDLEPLSGWFEAACAHIEAGAQVVGVNDLIERPQRSYDHATHFLLTRSYAQRPTIDNGRGPLHQGYMHWCCDDELIGTATARGVYAYAEDAHVRHLHPMNGLAPDDDTYRRGRVGRRHDLRKLAFRRRMWSR